MKRIFSTCRRADTRVTSLSGFRTHQADDIEVAAGISVPLSVTLVWPA